MNDHLKKRKIAEKSRKILSGGQTSEKKDIISVVKEYFNASHALAMLECSEIKKVTRTFTTVVYMQFHIKDPSKTVSREKGVHFIR